MDGWVCHKVILNWILFWMDGGMDGWMDGQIEMYALNKNIPSKNNYA